MGTNNKLTLYHGDDTSYAALALQSDHTSTGNSNGSWLGIDQTSAMGLYVWNYEAAPIRFGTSAVERMQLDSTGSLILQDGTTYTTNAPTYRGSLILAGASGATSYGGIEFHPNAGGGAGYGSKIGASDAEMTFSTRSNSATFTQRMVINANGQVGIGTGNPSTNFQLDVRGRAIVKAAGTLPDALLVTNNLTANVTGYAGVAANSTLTVNGNESEGSDVLRMGPMSNGTGDYFIDVSNSGGNADYDMLLQPYYGKVGIGTDTAERKLHIVGDTTSQGQYPLGLDAVNSDYTLEFRRSGVSQWWIAQGAGSFRIHENGVADMFRINATDGNIVLGRTRSIATETSYTQQTYQFWLDAHVNGSDEAAEEKDAVFSKIWRKSAVLHPGKYSNGNYYVAIGVTSADTVNYVTFKVNLYKATQLYASAFVANSADGTTRANKIYYSTDDLNYTQAVSNNWSAGGNTVAHSLAVGTMAGSTSGYFTGTVYLKFAIEGTGSGHTNLIGWQQFEIRARAQEANLEGGGFGRSKNDLTLSGQANTGHGYTPLTHTYGHAYSGTNQAAIVSANGGLQTFASKGLGHEEKSIFNPITSPVNGLQVLASGVLHIDFNQDIITSGSTSYASCTVQRRNSTNANTITVGGTLRTNTDGQWDMIQGSYICDVVAGDIISFSYNATGISSMDGGQWANYNFTLHPSKITSQGNAGATTLPWIHQ